jgi:predicted enzyme related to lactoylglutathione lyase
MTKTAQTPVPHWLFYFNVEAADAAAARVKANGGEVRNGPHQVPTGQWVLQALDPQGAVFGLLAPVR